MAADDLLRWRIGLVGYGEVGRILAEDLRARGVAEVSAYDRKLGGAEEAPAARACRSVWRDPPCVASRAGRRRRSRRLGGHREPGGAGRGGLRARPPQGRLLPGLELGLAGRQAARGPYRRRSGRPLRRGGGDDGDRALPHPRADAPGRPARRGPRTPAQRGRLRRQGRVRPGGQSLRHQDVPQCHHQGPGGDGDRGLHGRASPRGGERGRWPRWPRPSPASTGRSGAPTCSSA